MKKNVLTQIWDQMIFDYFVTTFHTPNRLYEDQQKSSFRYHIMQRYVFAAGLCAERT